MGFARAPPSYCGCPTARFATTPKNITSECAGPDSMRVSQMQKESQVTFHVAGNQEMLANVLMPLFAQSRGKGRVGKQEPDLVGRAFHRVCQKAGMLVNDLVGNAPHGGSHHRFLLP